MTMKYANILVPVALLLALSAQLAWAEGDALSWLQRIHAATQTLNYTEAARRLYVTQSGYQFDQARRVCYEQHEPVLVARAKCELGQMRRVPDPSHPGGVRIQMCGFVGHGTGAGQMHAMSPVY